jgi:hypothetical protein
LGNGTRPSAAEADVRILKYWQAALRESLLCDPNTERRVSVNGEAIQAGCLDPETHERLRKLWDESRGDSRKRRNSAHGKEDPIPVLVGRCTAEPVSAKSRSREGDIVAPVWVPALVFADGALKPDPEHLPFIPRTLLAPSLSSAGVSAPPAIAEFEEYDEKIRKREINRESDWGSRLRLAAQMFNEVAGHSMEEWLPQGWQRREPVIAIWNKEAGAETLLLPLVSDWVATGTLPGCLAILGECLSGKIRPVPLPATTIGPAASVQLGHVGGRPLNRKQREAVRAVGVLGPAALQAVNGPPGTGKTSLLKTLIADAVVHAAAEGREPPQILITSTNNQAVRNAADDLRVEEGGPPERQRWVPGLDRFALFVASRQGAANAKDLVLFDTVRTLVFSPVFQKEAKALFLERFVTWSLQTGEGVNTPAPGLTPTLEEAVAALKAALTDQVDRIFAQTARIARAERFLTERESMQVAVAAAQAEERDAVAGSDAAESAAGIEGTRVMEAERSRNAAILALRERAELHPLWIRLLDIIPPLQTRRAAMLRATAIAMDLLPEGTPVPETLQDVYDAVDRTVSAGSKAARSAAATLKREAEAKRGQAVQAGIRGRAIAADLAAGESALAELFACCSKADQCKPDAPPAEVIEAAHRQLDTGARAAAFDLAMRLREAQFLLAAPEWDAAWSTRNVKARETRPQMLRALTYLVPCTVATVFKAADHFSCFDGQTSHPLDLPVDLLIFDEAGQVLPELGLPLLGLARRAVAVGDIYQLEPITSFGEAADTQLLASASLTGDPASRLRRLGVNHTGGSVMRAFQAFTAWGDADTRTRGVMLTEHFRCRPSIIAYCNDLVYGGALVPQRSEGTPIWVRPMAWAHVRGLAERRGTSWRNAPEAEVIAEWLARHRLDIEGASGQKFAEAVAIVTPFAAQAGTLREALARRVGEAARGTTIGTVHTLQGAQRHLIVFSPTVTLAASGGQAPFFDRGPNMLNVAVSRAQDAFVVIGDMALFDADAIHQHSGLLARHLMLTEANELSDVLPGLAALAPERAVERIEGLEAHRSLLASALRDAESSLLITSPFLTAAAIEADAISDRIRSAVDRKITVHVYTGMRTGRDLNGDLAKVEQLRLAKAGAQVKVTGRVHAKTLVMDDKLVVEGSFNWLSATRDASMARKESSFAVRGHEAVSFATRIREEFEAMESRPVVVPAETALKMAEQQAAPVGSAWDRPSGRA